MPLGKVFDKIYEKVDGGIVIDSKADGEKLKSWFAEILPDYSRDKVYVSDIKKIALWYNLLHKLNLLVKDEPEAEAKDTPEEKSQIEAVPPAAKKKNPKKPKAE